MGAAAAIDPPEQIVCFLFVIWTITIGGGEAPAFCMFAADNVVGVGATGHRKTEF